MKFPISIDQITASQIKWFIELVIDMFRRVIKLYIIFIFYYILF